MGQTTNRRKIAILGGGVGAMTAAFELTETPNFNERYEITVYQLGWRLGGKGASGRNHNKGERIEEHGLHIWAGYYDNSFDIMQRCYGALSGREGFFQGWRSAFTPLSTAYMMQRLPENGGGDDAAVRYAPWRFNMPRNDLTPGKSSEIPGLWGCVQRVLDWLTVTHGAHGHPVTLAEYDATWIEPLLADLIAGMQRGVKTNWIDVARHALSELTDTPELHHHQHLHHCGLALRAFARCIHLVRTRENEALNVTGEPINDPQLERYRALLLMEYASTTVAGVLMDGVLFYGFDHLDDQEAVEWWRRHGASQELLDSTLVQGIYDYVFAHPEGIESRRDLAAGTALRSLIRMVMTYKDAFFFKMNAGMGDTIFSPLYQVLKDRGVNFRFFHEVTRLEVEDQTIKGIEIWPQWDGTEDYFPLRMVQDLWCWPSEPLYAHISNGDQLRALIEKDGLNLEAPNGLYPGRPEKRFMLERGADFDDVVLGISLGALLDQNKQGICGALYAENNRWQAMLDNIKCVQTQAMQLWLRPDYTELGYDDPETDLTGFEAPFDTWADMTDLLPMEDWRPVAKASGNAAPKTIAYFCNTLPTYHGDDPTGHVRRNAAGWINRFLPVLWPNAGEPGNIDWQILFDAEDRSGEARLDYQYFRANVTPSELYVQSVAGAQRYRMPADDSGYANLYLAGDWVRTGINAGCVEAAAMAGMAAARGITGRPLYIAGQDGLPEWRDRGKSHFTIPACLRDAVTPKGTISSYMVTQFVPAHDVQKRLPSGIRLDTAPGPLMTDIPPGLHPVFLMFSRQSNVGQWGRTHGLGMTYDEFALCIPFVAHTGRDGKILAPFTYAEFILNDPLAVLLGKIGYGYDKRFGRITRDPHSYSVQRRSGRPLIRCNIDDVDGPVSASRLPGFEATWQTFHQPLISKASWGEILYSNLSYDLESMEVRPFSGDVTVEQDSTLGLPAGVFPINPYSPGTLGGFMLKADWKLSSPLDSHPIRDKLRGNTKTNATPLRALLREAIKDHTAPSRLAVGTLRHLQQKMRKRLSDW